MDYYTVSLLIGVASIIASLVSVAYWLGSRLTRVEKDIERLGEGLGRLANAINGVGESIIEYLGLKGVLNQGEVNYLKSDIRRITLIATNPFTEAERRRLLELIDRGEDLTPEEADELLNLAKKFYNEYAGKVQDAWKMLYYAAAIHGIVHGRYERKATPPNPNP
jgi:hypothetical protein